MPKMNHTEDNSNKTSTFFLKDDEFSILFEDDGNVRFLATQPIAGTIEIGVMPMEEMGRALDKWLRKTYPEDPNRGFEGYIAEIWNHETHVLSELAYMSPGSVMPYFDTNDFVEWKESCGDRVVRLFNGHSEMIFDRKDEIYEELTVKIRPW